MICISPEENLIPSHADCMQHVLRCWERQPNDSEYKKTLPWPGLRPRPAVGANSAPAKPYFVGSVGCPLPKTSIPRSRPFRPRLFYPPPSPHSKISSDAVACTPSRIIPECFVLILHLKVAVSIAARSYVMPHNCALFISVDSGYSRVPTYPSRVLEISAFHFQGLEVPEKSLGS